MIFSFSITEKQFYTTQNFLQWKYLTCLKIILKFLEVTPDNSLVLQFFDAVMNLAPTDVLEILGNQYIIGRELSLSD